MAKQIDNNEPISYKEAVIICKRIRDENSKKMLSPAHWQCWGCEKYAKGDDKKRCFNCEGTDLNRGCSWINKVYDKK